MVCEGRKTFVPRLFNPVNACGLVTSCIKCLSIYKTEGPSAICLTTCFFQILSNNVFGIPARFNYFFVTSFLFFVQHLLHRTLQFYQFCSAASPSYPSPFGEGGRA